jgi:lysophospholipase L1-like esterase
MSSRNRGDACKLEAESTKDGVQATADREERFRLREFIRASSHTKWGHILSLFLLFLVCLLLLEGWARINTRPSWPNARYAAISSGYAELDALVQVAQTTIGPKYYEEFLYAPPPFSSAHINYTDYYGARLTPDSVPLAQAEHVVWAFGSSTMQNTETTDSLTIANTWAKEFNRSLGPTHVKNFGSGTYFSSYELIKFQKLLRDVPGNEHPTVAIFYDGYTDAYNGYRYGPGRLQTDLSLKLQALVEEDYLVTAAYALSRQLSHYSKFWEQRVDWRVESRLFPLPAPNAQEANLAETVRIYTSNVRMIEATCEAFAIQCFFVLQPMLVTKEPLSQAEQEALFAIEAHPRMGPAAARFIREFYARVNRELAEDEHLIDASHVLDGRTQADFYDIGHVGALSPPVIGEKTAHLILARLEEELPAAGDTSYPVSEPNWFFSPGNWFKSGSNYALTNNPGAYSKFRFRGTGLKLGIDLTLFEATDPNDSDYPYLKWRVDGGSWREQITTSGMTEMILARGLELADHTLEVYFESIQRNRDRWHNPPASISFTSATVLDGALLPPILRSQRWIAFGDSMSEGVCCDAADYDNVYQSAARTWSIQVGERLDAEVGIVAFTAQGFATPGPAPSQVPAFHTASVQTWQQLFSSQERNYTGIDAILVSHGTNDEAISDADLEGHVQGFLRDFRNANAGTTIYLLAPFGGARRAQITNAFHAYQAAKLDADCHLIDITDMDATLTEDLNGDATYSTYSYDGLHPNQAGHDRIAVLVSNAIDATLK